MEDQSEYVQQLLYFFTSAAELEKINIKDSLFNVIPFHLC